MAPELAVRGAEEELDIELCPDMEADAGGLALVPPRPRGDGEPRSPPRSGVAADPPRRAAHDLDDADADPFAFLGEEPADL